MAEMTKTFPVFDCDAHINDPMEIWEQYVPAKDKELVMNSYWQFREYAPNVLLNGRKMSWGGFKLGNNVPNPITSAGPGMTKAIIRTLRSIDLTPQQIDYLDHKGAYYAKDRIRDLDLMGIDQVLVIPTELIQHLPFIENHWGAAAMCRAYNNWVYDFCREYPERLYPSALLPLQNVSFAIEELRRVAKMGFPCALIRPIDPANNYPILSSFDSLWREYQEMGIVLGMHTFVAHPFVREGRYVYSPGELIEVWDNTGIQQDLSCQTVSFMWEAMAWLTATLTTGFLDRFPKLSMAIYESNGTWVPRLLNACDRYVKLHANERRHRIKRLPSEAFKAQCFLGFEGEEKPIFRMWDFFQDFAIWASDAYHHDGSDCWSAIEEMNKLEVPQGVQEKILGGNARRMYRIKPKLYVTKKVEHIERPAWFPTQEQAEALLATGKQVKAMDFGTAGYTTHGA